MKRRDFVTAVASAALVQAIGTRTLSARTSSKKPTIVWLSLYYGFDVGKSFVTLFLQGLRDLGYVPDRNIDIQFRNAGNDWDRLPAVVEEVVQLKPDVIFAPATLEAVAARKATSTIPIVCAALANSIELGLIASEARPGGNVTGIEPYVAGLPAKQIELAREIMPGVKTIGLLANSRDPKGAPQVPELETVAHVAGLKMITVEVNSSENIDDAVKELASKSVDFVIVLQTGLLVLNSRRIAEAAIAARLPTIYGYREHVIAGGLISYGVDLRWLYPRSAYFVDRILNGTSPADLPIEFPTQFPLSVNVKTAKSLGLTIPATLLARADEVVE
jgi:putative tryptophan/tyrosine transport system substrate-binding protein